MVGRVTRSRGVATSAVDSKGKVKKESNALPKPAANISKKRKRDTTVKTEPKDDPTKRELDDQDSPSKSKKTKKTTKTTKPIPKGASAKDLQAGAEMAEKFAQNRDAQRDEPSPDRKARAKANPYGLSPGESPFPKYNRPTPEECQNVKDLLAKAHGDVEAPKTIPTPSLNSSGCGEVPSVLDALIRTRLSAATNNANSSRAFRGLVETFGLLKSGVGKGSVDWNAVRNAPQKDVFEAIKSGGLADVKSRDIKKILDLVYEENQARKQNIKQEKKAGEADNADEAEEERKREVEKADAEVLSLDHLHLLSSDAAFNKLLEYPGIGPKTASCVLLFCMQRPSFAVDTHVFRLCKWLEWVPTEAKAKALARAEAKETGEKVKSATVTREKTYAHLDIRIPDELKYPLHYLLIRHGKQCPWCSAKAGQASKVGTCPVAHLMSGKGRNKGLAKWIKEEEEGEEEGEEGNEDSEEGSEDEELHGMKV